MSIFASCASLPNYLYIRQGGEATVNAIVYTVPLCMDVIDPLLVSTDQGRVALVSPQRSSPED